jgi:hypothetical protein
VCEAFSRARAERVRARTAARAITRSATAPWASCLFNNVALRGVVAARARHAAHRDHRLGPASRERHAASSSRRTRASSTSRPHQYPCYPGTGASTRWGGERGEGRTLNLPFPPGFGDAEYARCLRRGRAADLPRIRARLRPGLRGLRCDQRDPLGGHGGGRRPASRAWRARLPYARGGDGRRPHIAAVLEGATNLSAIVEGVDETLAALRGRRARPAAGEPATPATRPRARPHTRRAGRHIGISRGTLFPLSTRQSRVGSLSPGLAFARPRATRGEPNRLDRSSFPRSAAGPRLAPRAPPLPDAQWPPDSSRRGLQSAAVAGSSTSGSALAA